MLLRVFIANRSWLCIRNSKIVRSQAEISLLSVLTPIRRSSKSSAFGGCRNGQGGQPRTFKSCPRLSAGSETFACLYFSCSALLRAVQRGSCIGESPKTVSAIIDRPRLSASVKRRVSRGVQNQPFGYSSFFKEHPSVHRFRLLSGQGTPCPQACLRNSEFAHDELMVRPQEQQHHVLGPGSSHQV